MPKTKLNIKLNKEWVLLIIFVLLFAIMSILSPTKFFSAYNFQMMASQLPEFGIIALGMMVVILTSGINLSVATTAALSGVVAGVVLSKMTASHQEALGVFLAIVICLGFSVICGALNGTVIAYFGVTAILVTLATQMLFQGVSLLITKGGSISGFPLGFMKIGNGTIAGIPVQILIYIVVIALVVLLLEHTPWGYKVYMAGCNPVATNYCGINVKKVLMKVYLFSGFLCGIAGLIMMSRYNSAKDDYGSSYVMQSVSAAVLGGTDIAGGYGKVFGVVTATCILQVLSSGLNILGVNSYIINIVNGGVLILVLAINFVTAKRAEARGKREIQEKLAKQAA